MKKKTNNKTTSKEETIAERVHRHLTDKNDVITDEDIKNAKIDTTVKHIEFADEYTDQPKDDKEKM